VCPIWTVPAPMARFLRFGLSEYNLKKEMGGIYT
jgi:hypothetical protein